MGVNYGSYAADQVTPEGDMIVDVPRIVEMARTLLDLSAR